MHQYVTNLTTDFTDLFLILLLPPIIFEAGYNMKKKPFWKNIGAILSYSFLGTFLAIASTSLMFKLCSTFVDPPLSWQDSFAFGALISATDPVSCLAIFKELGTDQNLHAIVFGESIFNDAVAIVMYNAVVSVDFKNSSVGAEIGSALGLFTIVFLGSLVIGIVSALVIAFITKRQKAQQFERECDPSHKEEHHDATDDVMTEVALMLVAPYASYLIAEGLELSGIVAILINGIFLSYYASPNLSNQANSILKLAYGTIAFTAETLVFIFLGLGLFAIDHPFSQLTFGFVLLTIVNLNIARAVNILITSALVNLGRSTESRIKWNEQFVMWISGLRGAMAYALALKSSTELAEGPVILIDTVIYSLFTILIVASILNPVLTWADVKQKDDPETDKKTLKISEVIGHQDKCLNRCKKRIRSWDSLYFSPLWI